jgi:hypothetical protein
VQELAMVDGCVHLVAKLVERRLRRSIEGWR